MGMRKVALHELSQDVRSFLAQVATGEGILVEDETGRARYGVIPYHETPPRQQAAALKRLERLQKKVGTMMRRTGKTEEEFDRLVQRGE